MTFQKVSLNEIMDIELVLIREGAELILNCELYYEGFFWATTFEWSDTTRGKSFFLVYFGGRNVLSLPLKGFDTLVEYCSNCFPFLNESAAGSIHVLSSYPQAHMLQIMAGRILPPGILLPVLQFAKLKRQTPQLYLFCHFMLAVIEQGRIYVGVFVGHWWPTGWVYAEGLKKELKEWNEVKEVFLDKNGPHRICKEGN